MEEQTIWQEATGTATGGRRERKNAAGPDRDEYTRRCEALGAGIRLHRMLLVRLSQEMVELADAIQELDDAISRPG